MNTIRRLRRLQACRSVGQGLLNSIRHEALQTNTNMANSYAQNAPSFSSADFMNVNMHAAQFSAQSFFTQGRFNAQ